MKEKTEAEITSSKPYSKKVYYCICITYIALIVAMLFINTLNVIFHHYASCFGGIVWIVGEGISLQGERLYYRGGAEDSKAGAKTRIAGTIVCACGFCIIAYVLLFGPPTPGILWP